MQTSCSSSESQTCSTSGKPQITAYLKTTCGWSKGVRAILTKYDLPYEEKNITENPNFRIEMEQKSGQQLSPCVIVNGTMLSDISGAELEQYMVSKNLVQSSDAACAVPINSSCSTEEHAAKQRA